MTTTIQFRKRSNGVTSLVNVKRVVQIGATEHPDGWGIHFSPPVAFVTDKTKNRYPAIAWGLDRQTADQVVRLIGKAVAEKKELVDIDDLVQIAEQNQYYAENGICPEEVPI